MYNEICLIIEKNLQFTKNKEHLLKTTCTFKVKFTVVITDSNVGSSYLYMNRTMKRSKYDFCNKISEI